jgi:hypothetical protein
MNSLEERYLINLEEENLVTASKFSFTSEGKNVSSGKNQRHDIAK